MALISYRPTKCLSNSVDLYINLHTYQKIVLHNFGEVFRKYKDTETFFICHLFGTPKYIESQAVIQG